MLALVSCKILSLIGFGGPITRAKWIFSTISFLFKLFFFNSLSLIVFTLHFTKSKSFWNLDTTKELQISTCGVMGSGLGLGEML